jgi:hypothetical protein
LISGDRPDFTLDHRVPVGKSVSIESGIRPNVISSPFLFGCTPYFGRTKIRDVLSASEIRELSHAHYNGQAEIAQVDRGRSLPWLDGGAV